MAKTSMIMREKKRQRTVAKYAKKRAALKESIRDPKLSDEARWEATQALQKLPRDASRSRSAHPLRNHGPSERCVSPLRSGPQQIARGGHARGHPGPGQVQLVSPREVESI
jgi:hypothetical protein